MRHFSQRWPKQPEPAAKPKPAGSEAVLPSSAPDGLTPAELAERQQIVQVLERCAGSQTAAARMLNMARSTLVERIKRYSIPRPRSDREA
jgi:DNA-binding NtrC family response regulator